MKEPWFLHVFNGSWCLGLLSKISFLPQPQESCQQVVFTSQSFNNALAGEYKFISFLLYLPSKNEQDKVHRTGNPTPTQECFPTLAESGVCHVFWRYFRLDTVSWCLLSPICFFFPFPRGLFLRWLLIKFHTLGSISPVSQATQQWHNLTCVLCSQTA